MRGNLAGNVPVARPSAVLTDLWPPLARCGARRGSGRVPKRRLAAPHLGQGLPRPRGDACTFFRTDDPRPGAAVLHFQYRHGAEPPRSCSLGWWGGRRRGLGIPPFRPGGERKRSRGPERSAPPPGSAGSATAAASAECGRRRTTRLRGPGQTSATSGAFIVHPSLRSRSPGYSVRGSQRGSSLAPGSRSGRGRSVGRGRRTGRRRAGGGAPPPPPPLPGGVRVATRSPEFLEADGSSPGPWPGESTAPARRRFPRSGAAWPALVASRPMGQGRLSPGRVGAGAHPLGGVT